MASAAFISFSGADEAPAGEIARELERHGLSLSASPDRMQAILDARCVVAVLSRAAEADETVHRDLAFATANGRPIAPLLLGDLTSEALRPVAELTACTDARSGLSNTALARVADTVRGWSGPNRAIAMLNIKGGVGKTVLAANLFAAAHLEGNRSVCFVDLDPQHNLTQFFLPPEERNRVRADAHTIYSVFIAKGPLSAPRAEFGRTPVPLNRSKSAGSRRFDIVLGDERLFEFTIDGRSDRERVDALSRFHDLMATLRTRYDLVVIDANPCATFLTRCAVSAADHIVAPVRPEKYSLTGLNMLEQVAHAIRGRPLRSAEFSVLLNGVGDRPRSRGGADVDAATRAEIAQAPFFGSALLEEAIPFTAALRTTPMDGYAPNPINLTAMRSWTQRALKEQLTGAAQSIVRRAAG
jgi:chromosome partitioning protein